MRRSARRTAAAFLAIGAIAAGFGVLAHSIDLFDGPELDTVDARYSIRGDQPIEDDIVFVEIDDDTFSDLDEQWPFDRSRHAELIDRLSDAEARAIAYDVQFTEPTERKEDAALISAVDRAGNVVLATAEVDRRGRSNIFGGEEVLREIGARAGSTLIEPGADGVWRQFPYDEQGLESFAVATAEVASGEAVDPASFGDSDAWIDYRGPSGTFPTVSFSQVLAGEVDPERFSDAIVVVGASSPTLQDVHPTPVGGAELMPGAEIQANAIATVLAGLPLDSAPGWLDIALIVMLGFVAPVAGIGLRPLLTFGLAIGVGAVYLLVAQLTFGAGTILPVVDPLLALAIGAVGTLGLHYLVAAFERQRVRDTFARFVPVNVVDEVLERAGGELRLGGVRRECTVLFSDLRGFTSYAEGRPPDQVVEVLNRYLGEMTDAIMDHGGTLVSYLGDGILAVFGAPIEQPDHADRALAAAWEMLDVRLERFSAWMRASGHGEGFRMGIGINSGEVMSGQVGSERRMEYTTIGDTANTASRLEGMTKGTGYQVYIADSTRNLLGDSAADLVLVGDLPIRGRESEIRVWALVEGEARDTAGASSDDASPGPIGD